jgi:5-formyltetrahydrofolate cyclo-ligase
MTQNKQELRTKLRSLRLAVSDEQAKIAAEIVCSKALAMSCYQTAKNIALYWGHDNELNTKPLIEASLKQGKNCFLPVLCLKSHQTLAFASYTLNTPLIKNRYAIPEPDLGTSYLIDIADLDLIFTPLVGFDEQGRRLGRGGGFYDATLAEFHRHKHEKSPLLIGLAYDLQYVAEIPVDSWDWQLDAVITDKRMINFKLDSQ